LQDLLKLYIYINIKANLLSLTVIKFKSLKIIHETIKFLKLTLQFIISFRLNLYDINIIK
ncbi:hypothetical protein, partial [Campylobacter ureolyticus]|uniref:hypothetical protein n=1 Tax=Campylobacter ureolyticus TaxID=827 RepID=UPI0022B2F127